MGRPGAAYVDLPSDVLGAHAGLAVLNAAAGVTAGGPSRIMGCADNSSSSSELFSATAAAAAALRGAKRPLLVAGRGAAMAHAENGN